MYPFGAVQPDNLSALIHKTGTFLQQAPMVAQSNAFSLKTSMDQTLELYHSALGIDHEEQ